MFSKNVSPQDADIFKNTFPHPLNKKGEKKRSTKTKGHQPINGQTDSQFHFVHKYFMF